MNEGAIADRLQELGLTSYQAKTYVAAVQLGTSQPAGLAEQSGVPQSRVYDVIDDLQGMGLVEVREGSGGKEIAAPPPKQALEAFKERRVSDFVGTLDTVMDGLDSLDQPDSMTGQFVTMVGLRRSALRHIRRAIEAADWWLSLALPIDVFRDVEEDVVEAIERGVNVRLVVPENDDENPAVSANTYPDGLAVRQRLLADTLTVADRQYAVFSSLASRDESPPYIIILEPSLVFQLQHFFEQFWPASTPIQTVERYPRRYLDPWRTLKDLRAELDAGEEFQATVTGYHNHLQKTGVWEGRITGYDLSGPVPADYAALLPTKANLFMTVDGETLGVGGRRARQMDIAADGLEIDRI